MVYNNPVKNALVGSPSRDQFKSWHKQSALIKWAWGCDLDFLLIEKHPPCIAAALDYKRKRDDLTFTEIIAYNHLTSVKIPVFIVVSDDFVTFDIFLYLTGDHRPRPPSYELRPIVKNGTAQDYWDWEKLIRSEQAT